jgi:hypothetical protein
MVTLQGSTRQNSSVQKVIRRKKLSNWQIFFIKWLLIKDANWRWFIDDGLVNFKKKWMVGVLCH